MTLNQMTIRHLDTLMEQYPALNYLRDSLTAAVELICECHNNGGKLLICGNGGSAADSEHIVGELMKSFVLPRKPSEDDISKLKASGYVGWEDIAGKLQRGVAAVSLVGHPALASAISNDTDPSMIFAQQVYVLGRPGDVLIGISTSGNAANVMNAMRIAKAFGLKSVGLCGCRECAMDDAADVLIKVPTKETYQVQEYHLPIYHTICLMVEEYLFG